MKTLRPTRAERAGRVLGRAWRGGLRQEARAVHWMGERGVPASVAKAVLWMLKLAVLGVLLYVVFWLAVLLVCAVVAAWTAHNSRSDEPEEWAIGDQADHKRSVFYDPINYDDDPDPRFDEER